jgi:hypothetical protein
MVLSVEIPTARGESPTPEALRARKLAARRYEGMAVALPESAFSNGLHVCARETPSGINGYWKVPAKVVDLIDAELLVHLRKSRLARRNFRALALRLADSGASNTIPRAILGFTAR